MNQAQPVIVLTHVRSGGTMLMEALSNHPDIFAPRGEVLLPAGSFKQHLDTDDLSIIKALTTLEMYRYAAVKVQWHQLTDDIMGYLHEEKPLVIVLCRRNLLRVAVSGLLAGRTGRHHHTRDHENNLAPANLQVSHIMSLMKRLKERQDEMLEFVDNYDGNRLYFNYDELVGAEGNEITELPLNAIFKLCAFLDLETRTFPVKFRKVTRRPIAQLVPDWATLQYVVKHSEFVGCLQDEEEYERQYANSHTNS